MRLKEWRPADKSFSRVLLKVAAVRVCVGGRIEKNGLDPLSEHTEGAASGVAVATNERHLTAKRHNQLSHGEGNRTRQIVRICWLCNRHH